VRAYRFRLDSVLRVRRLQEQAAAQRLALAARELHAAEAGLARARDALGGLSAPSGQVSADAVHWSQAQSARMSDTARQRAEEVEAADVATRQAKEAWGSARQRTAMLERLDERHVAVWRAELDRREVAERDDLTTARASGEGQRR
jgi:flagellar export protein FliJ